MSDGDDDAWVSLGAIAAQVVEGVARPGATPARCLSGQRHPPLLTHSPVDGLASGPNARVSAFHAARHSGTRPELNGAAPVPQGGGETGAGARGNKPGVKRLCRAHHRGYGEGRTATILKFVPRRGRARPNTSPATMGELHRITGEGLDPSGYPPDAVRLGNARRAKRV